MVAQSSANFPIFRGHARQRGRGFGALAQTLGRTAISFITKYIVPATKRIGADLSEIAAPDIKEVVSGQKNSKHLQKMFEQKQLGGGKKKSKRRTRRAISRKSSSKISHSRKDIFDKIK